MEVTDRIRWYQADFYNALVNREKDRLMAVWHRRAGKDEVVLKAMRLLAHKEIGTYWHCFPEMKQARKAIWNGVNQHTGKRRIFDAFPEPLIERMQDADMFLELKCGSTFQLIGSDRFDATVGSGPRGIAYSEWAISNPSAWAYHSPMIRETQGWAAFITTPRGNNHAKTMAGRAARSPEWFYQCLSIEETGALTPAQLREAQDEYQDLYGLEMGRAFYEQEYLCSFAGAVVGSYFGAEINRASREGRIGPLEIDSRYPVHTVWDLGKAVNNPIWCFQIIPHAPQPLRIVDFYVPDSDDLADWCRWLDAKGYNGNDYVPHDILTTDWGSKRTRMDVLKGYGRKPKRLARVSVADGLQAGRTAINQAMFADNEAVRHGVEGLRNYRREWDDERKTFREHPVKDWAEHIGSAWRYLGLAWREIVPREEKSRPPTELAYEVRPDGRVVGNMDVRAAVKAMRRRRERD